MRIGINNIINPFRGITSQSVAHRCYCRSTVSAAGSEQDQFPLHARVAQLLLDVNLVVLLLGFFAHHFRLLELCGLSDELVFMSKLLFAELPSHLALLIDHVLQLFLQHHVLVLLLLHPQLKLSLGLLGRE